MPVPRDKAPQLPPGRWLLLGGAGLGLLCPAGLRSVWVEASPHHSPTFHLRSGRRQEGCVLLREEGGHPGQLGVGLVHFTPTACCWAFLSGRASKLFSEATFWLPSHPRDPYGRLPCASHGLGPRGRAACTGWHVLQYGVSLPSWLSSRCQSLLSPGSQPLAAWQQWPH